MKGLVPFLIGGAMIATAQAQSRETRVDMLPLPNTLPLVFFAPDSLAGTMLKPLTVPETPPQAAEQTPAPPPEPRPREAVAQVEPEHATSPDAAAPAEAQPEPPAAAEPPPPAPAPAATIIHVIVENVESNRGTVNVAVCDKDFSPEGCPYHTSIPATRGFVEVVFDDVPPGSYAVVGYHDVNDNHQFDKFLSMPREPYALSGAAADELIPAFKDAMLKIKQGENYVIIRMKRLGNG